jgi:endonuclease YncB( thermonuclease family)
MRRRLLAALLAALAAAAFFAWIIPGPAFRQSARGRMAGPNNLHGAVRVIDGDTLDVDGRRIRLFGIDAPERAQSCTRQGVAYACGHDATEAMRALAGDTLTCEGRDTDRYRRLVAVCWHNGKDINAAMVEGGWAVAYRQYSTDYVGAENAAKRAGRGLWSGEFQMPALWRRDHRH